MAQSAVSRRLSEFAGVALFGASVLWLVALVSYEPNDPIWFFKAVNSAEALNFAGRVGAFLASVTLWGTLQALSTALAGTLVILAIRHRVDFRLDE